MDETYIKVKGEWSSLYRAVDQAGPTIDFLLTEQRDEPAATRFLTKASERHGVPKKITIDGTRHMPRPYAATTRTRPRHPHPPGEIGE